MRTTQTMFCRFERFYRAFSTKFGSFICDKYSSQFIEQRTAALLDIAPCGFKFSGVPRVGYISRPACVVKQTRHFAVRVAAANAAHSRNVGAIHADQQIVFFVILRGHLPCRVLLASDAVCSQNPARRRIDRIAKFLPAHCRR